MDTTDEAPLEGRVLDGRYRILEPLGEGGMGAVYVAEHVKLGRKVALKLLRAELGDDETLRARFAREAQAAGALSHAHVVAVTDYGVAEDMPYLVMELLRGRTLRDRIAEGPLDPSDAFRIAREALLGLQYAHDEGITHRDLKPANVFLQALPDGREQVKLLDFGLAKLSAADARAGSPLTRMGTVLGTPSYMAPEQAAGDATDARSDLYALGIVLFEMLAGERPFDGPSGEVLRQQILMPLPSISGLCPTREASPELQALLERMTAKARTARFQDAREALAALDALPQPAVRVVAPRPSAATTAAAGRPLPAAVRLDASAAAGAPERNSSAPRWIVPAILAAGALLLVGGVAVAVIALLVLREPSAERPTIPASVTLHPPPAVETSASASPWGGAVPPLLSTLDAQTKRGADVSSRADGQLRSYARQHPGDPRPYLLLARIYLRRGWRPDAIEHYEKAHEQSATAAGDPVMLMDLVTLSAHRNTSRRAGALLRRAYGARALPAIDAALARDDLDREDRARLTGLRASLGS